MKQGDCDDSLLRLSQRCLDENQYLRDVASQSSELEGDFLGDFLTSVEVYRRIRNWRHEMARAFIKGRWELYREHLRSIRCDCGSGDGMGYVRIDPSSRTAQRLLQTVMPFEEVLLELQSSCVPLCQACRVRFGYEIGLQKKRQQEKRKSSRR